MKYQLLPTMLFKKTPMSTQFKDSLFEFMHDETLVLSIVQL